MTKLTTGKIHSSWPPTNIKVKYFSQVLQEAPLLDFFNLGNWKYDSATGTISIEFEFGTLLSRQELYDLFNNPPVTEGDHFIFVTNIDLVMEWAPCRLPPKQDGRGFLEPTMDGTVNTPYWPRLCRTLALGPEHLSFDARATHNGVDVIHHYLRLQPLTLTLGTVDGNFVYKIRQDNIFTRVHYTPPFDTGSLRISLSTDPTVPNTLSFQLLQPFNTQIEPFRILPMECSVIGHHEQTDQYLWHELDPPSFPGVKYYKQNNRYPFLKEAFLAQMAVFDQEVQEHSRGRMTFNEKMDRIRFFDHFIDIMSDWGVENPIVTLQGQEMQVEFEAARAALDDIWEGNVEDPYDDPSNDL